MHNLHMRMYSDATLEFIYSRGGAHLRVSSGRFKLISFILPMCIVLWFFGLSSHFVSNITHHGSLRDAPLEK